MVRIMHPFSRACTVGSRLRGRADLWLSLLFVFTSYSQAINEGNGLSWIQSLPVTAARVSLIGTPLSPCFPPYRRRTYIDKNIGTRKSGPPHHARCPTGSLGVSPDTGPTSRSKRLGST
ncbi:hypothetical protein DB88DRAFT_484241 [Papiliotrema laurentii]|uniref:Secreted protein n=1 Tax=Papiliotrema laurentii TaxID=5418 RepID=A0AAD9FSV3_PAPLA|nr:hypothetical protein DB88DRAFT_484241 [Papiliotrema laurentii]